MSKFKVGDKVVIARLVPVSGDMQAGVIGHVGVIEKITGEGHPEWHWLYPPCRGACWTEECLDYYDLQPVSQSRSIDDIFEEKLRNNGIR